MLRRFFSITFVFLLYLTSFSESKLNFHFNTSRGYIEYTNLSSGLKYGLNFSGSRSHLDLPEGRYKFQFFSPDYHPEERLITSDDTFQSYRIDLERKVSTFFISAIESRKQEVYLSDKPVNMGKTLDDSKIIFYKDDVPVKSLDISSLLEPIRLDHGYYDISLIRGNETIFRVQRFPINDRGGKFINFFTSPPQVNIKGFLKVDDMFLGGGKVIFTDVDNNTYSMISNFSGEFSGFLPAKKYRIKVERFGYRLKDEVNLLYDFTSTAASYNLPLELEEILSSIGGRVFDDQDSPVDNAKVTIKIDGISTETSTDNYGRFNGETGAGLVFIKVEKDGYFHHGIVQRIEKSSTISNLEIKVTRKLFSLSGIISDGVAPVKKQRLDLIDSQGKRVFSTLSGDNGFFEFLDIPATEEFYIKSSVKGYTPYYSDPLTLDKNKRGFNVILNPAGSRVVLQILDESDTPIGDTTLLVEGTEISTDLNGMIYVEPTSLPLKVSLNGMNKTIEIDGAKEIYELRF